MLRSRLLSAAVALGLLTAVVPSASAQEQAAGPEGAPATPPTVLSPTRVIVQWAPGADHGDRVEAREEAEVRFRSNLGDPDFQLVSVAPGQEAGRAIGELEDDPAVVLAERDGYRSLHAIPNDPEFSKLWGLRNLGLGVGGVTEALSGADISVLTAWDREIGEPTTVVADIDSGYRFEYADLAAVAWTNPDEIANGLDDDANGIVDDLHGADFIGANGQIPTSDGDPTDEDLLSGGHGVHTAGTIGAAGNDGVGITGVAQDVRIMPLRVCSRFPSLEDNRCAFSSIVAAINYAGAKGARAANMSLGGNTFTQSEVNAIAANPDVLFVVSAGNDGGDNDGGGAAPQGHHYPCDYRPTVDALPPVPGAIDNIVCVAATDQADRLAGFSDWGAASVDLGAPGTETLSTYPVVTPLKDSFSADDFAARWPATGADGGFERSDEEPLTSFGMTDVVGAPSPETVRETTSAAVTVPPSGGCKLTQTRRVVLGSGGAYRYSVLLDGVEQAISSPSSTASPGLERRFLQLPAAFNAGGSVQVRFRFTTGASPSAGSGVWLDDVSLACIQGVGQGSAYGFLQGTSMAAPHVTGAAGLLFSLEPSATVTEVRDALLAGVDAIPALAGKTTTGGRLDVDKAMDSLEGIAVDNVAPPKPILTGTVPTGGNDNHPRVRGSADAGAVVTLFKSPACAGPPFAQGTAEELAGAGIEITVPDNSITFLSAWATDAGRNRSACSAPTSYLEDSPPPIEVPPDRETPNPSEPSGPAAPSSPPPPPPATPTCTVPKLAGKTLGQAKTALAGARCVLGKVTKPKPRKGKRLPALVVKSSSPAAGATTSGPVNLTLGPKPKPKRH